MLLKEGSTVDVSVSFVVSRVVEASEDVVSGVKLEVSFASTLEAEEAEEEVSNVKTSKVEASFSATLEGEEDAVKDEVSNGFFGASVVQVWIPFPIISNPMPFSSVVFCNEGVNVEVFLNLSHSSFGTPSGVSLSSGILINGPTFVVDEDSKLVVVVVNELPMLLFRYEGAVTFPISRPTSGASVCRPAVDSSGPISRPTRLSSGRTGPSSPSRELNAPDDDEGEGDVEFHFE